MMRYLSIFALFFLSLNASAKDILIKWHGQSFFEIKSSKDTTIAIDPHNLEAYGRRQVEAKAVLISHYHIDHVAPEPITNFDKAKKLYGLKKKEGSPPGKNEEFNEFDEKVEDIRIQSIGSYHDNMQGLKRGKNSIFIIEIDGLRIVHLGDLGHVLTQAQVKAIGKVDVLMIPVGGIYTINGSEAKQVVEQLKPRRHVIPMHYGTKVYDYLLGPDEFLEDQEEKLIKRYKHNELTIDADAEPKKDPTIIILSYEPK